MTERLLAFLRGRANARAIALASEESLLRELDATHDALASGLAALERDGVVEILSPLPFLVVKIRKWSGGDASEGVSGAAAYSSGAKLFQTKHAIASYRRDGATGTGAADEGLLREILETLGETDPASFEGAIRNYSPVVIRKALDRVRRAHAIRKNRTALFRYLLGKLSQPR